MFVGTGRKKPNYTKMGYTFCKREFYNEQKEFKKEGKDLIQSSGYFIMTSDEAFNYEGINKLVIDNDDLEGNELVVNKVQKTSSYF